MGRLFFQLTRYSIWWIFAIEKNRTKKIANINKLVSKRLIFTELSHPFQLSFKSIIKKQLSIAGIYTYIKYSVWRSSLRNVLPKGRQKKIVKFYISLNNWDLSKHKRDSWHFLSMGITSSQKEILCYLLDDIAELLFCDTNDMNKTQFFFFLFFFFV